MDDHIHRFCIYRIYVKELRDQRQLLFGFALREQAPDEDE